MIFDIEEMLPHYLQAVEFTDFGDEGQPERGADFADEALLQAREDCLAFIDTVANNGLMDEYALRGGTAEQFGHDFWLTRNHHGAGFWDRGLGGLGEQLTHHAHHTPERYTYQGDDGLVYFG